MSKAAIKRNLFGEQNEDETSSILAKQLTDSPGGQQPCAFLMDPAIQSMKCNEFSYKAQTFTKGMKGSMCKHKVFFGMYTIYIYIVNVCFF